MCGVCPKYDNTKEHRLSLCSVLHWNQRSRILVLRVIMIRLGFVASSLFLFLTFRVPISSFLFPFFLRVFPFLPFFFVTWSFSFIRSIFFSSLSPFFAFPSSFLCFLQSVLTFFRSSFPLFYCFSCFSVLFIIFFLCVSLFFLFFLSYPYISVHRIVRHYRTYFLFNPIIHPVV